MTGWQRPAGPAFRMPKPSRPLVRRAERGDAAALAALGQALNVQQGDPSTNFTAEAVRRDGFGEAPRFEAWVAEVDGQTVGYALVVPAASKPAMRRPACSCKTCSWCPRPGNAASVEH